MLYECNGCTLICKVNKQQLLFVNYNQTPNVQYIQIIVIRFLNADIKEATILNVNQILHLIELQKSLPSRQLLFKIWDKQNMANLKVKILT